MKRCATCLLAPTSERLLSLHPIASKKRRGLILSAASYQSNGFGFVAVVIVFLTIALAGATAGAIHGFALVWLLQSHQLEAELASPSEANTAQQSTGSAFTESLGAAGRKASI